MSSTPQFASPRPGQVFRQGTASAVPKTGAARAASAAGGKLRIRSMHHRNSRTKISRGLSREKSSPPGVTPAKTLAGGSGSHQAPHFVTPQSRVCFPRRRAHRRSEARAKVPAAAIQPAAAKRYAKMTNRERIPQFAHSNTDAVPPPSPPRRSNRLPRFSFSSTARPRPSRTYFPQIVE
jgi:hypothetical protein